MVTVVLKRPTASQGSQGSLQKKTRLSTKENRVSPPRNEYLQWLQEYKEEKKNEERKRKWILSLFRACGFRY